MIFSPFPFNEALYDICSWLKHGGLPVIVLDQGRFPPQMLPLLEEQPSLSLMSGTEKTLSVWGPEPGAWYLVAGYTGPHITERTHTCHPMMSLMAEYLIETDIITVIPTYGMPPTATASKKPLILRIMGLGQAAVHIEPGDNDDKINIDDANHH